jgi:hypothetical protein
MESQGQLQASTGQTGGGVGQTGHTQTGGCRRSEKLPGFSSSVPMVCDNKSASDPAPEDDEELVDYGSSPERVNLDINVIHMSMDGYVLSEEYVAHLDIGPKEAIF